MITLNDIKLNKKRVEKSLGEIHIDSIYLETPDGLENVYFQPETLHELRSASKILVLWRLELQLVKN